jgi:hypothetical protein
MAAKSYRLKIVHEGREFEAEGDKAFVLQMLKQYGPQTLGTAIGEAASGKRSREKLAQAVVSPTASKSLSIREFVQQLNLKKHTDITVAFGYYLERHQGVSEFTPADINNCYYEAKLEASNTSQMIIQNIRRGYLMASKKKGEKGKSRYTLTSSGEKFVESKLQSSIQ